MNVKHAKEVARQWVLQEGVKTPNFRGAFYHGSLNWLPDDAELPATSDVDVMVVLADANPPNKMGKFLHNEVLLEVSYLPSDRLQSAEQVLSDYHLAGSFHRPSVISDTSGGLTELQSAVSRDYAKRQWVYKRCEHAQNNILRFLDGLNASRPFPEQVMAWLFAAGVTTHILLVAGLKNPTVRRRYAAARELLTEYGFSDFHQTLLEMLGCAKMSRSEVTQHLDALTEAFDAAKTVVKPSYRFAADLSDLARPVAIDGSREMIESGFHREAVFWIVATYSRCQSALSENASAEAAEKMSLGYRHLLGALGIASFADLQWRGEQVRAFLPRVWQVAEAIIAANPAIEP